MLSALRAYDQVRDPGAIRSWLFSIASRKAIDAHRARARGPEPMADLEQLATTDERGPSDGVLWQHVRSLPPKQRQAVSLRYVADLSHREIATVMQTSEAAARRNVYEALVHLRSHAEA
jgi:RNA polymerase sigma factor (sigma-70 family)